VGDELMGEYTFIRRSCKYPTAIAKKLPMGYVRSNNKDGTNS